MQQNRNYLSFLHFFVEIGNKIKLLLVENGVRAKIFELETHFVEHVRQKHNIVCAGISIS
jgi:hypothetical protein